MASSGTPSPETLLPGNGHTNMRSLLQITCSSKGKRTHIWSACIALLMPYVVKPEHWYENPTGSYGKTQQHESKMGTTFHSATRRHVPEEGLPVFCTTTTTRNSLTAADHPYSCTHNRPVSYKKLHLPHQRQSVLLFLCAALRPTSVPLRRS